MYYNRKKKANMKFEWDLRKNHLNTIGSINGFITVIVVVYCDRGDVIRIISARKANAKEREVYYGKKIN